MVNLSWPPMEKSIKRIIFISKKKFPIQRIQQYFALEYMKEYDVQLCSKYSEAEQLLLDSKYIVSLLVVDFRETSLFRDIQILKEQECFGLLPILGIIPEITEVTLSALINCGCQSYLDEIRLKTSLIEYIYMLLENSNRMEINCRQISQLRAKNQQDTVLLDIVRNYVPKAVWRKAENFAQTQQQKLDSEESELVVCFADICQFSTLSQQKQPQQIMNILNVAFEVATRYIYHFSGDIDRFIGDTLLAIFDDVEQAIKASYCIQKDLDEINRGKNSDEVIEFRIGMHIGKVLRGNIGGNKRYDYALMGDTIQRASRLESRSPNGGFVISKAMHDRLGFTVPEEYRCSAELKGNEGREIYYLMFDYLQNNPDAMPELQAELEAIKSDTDNLKYTNEEYLL